MRLVGLIQVMEESSVTSDCDFTLSYYLLHVIFNVWRIQCSMSVCKLSRSYTRILNNQIVLAVMTPGASLEVGQVGTI